VADTIRISGIAPATDLVERQFRPSSPNVLWVADITYLRTGEGWLYLAAVQDAYLRTIVTNELKLEAAFRRL
jgi:transposase InsO family protein